MALLNFALFYVPIYLKVNYLPFVHINVFCCIVVLYILSTINRLITIYKYMALSILVGYTDRQRSGVRKYTHYHV